MRGRAARIRRSPRLKLVLASLLVVGALGTATVRSAYGLLSSEVGNRGTSISSGTLTLNDTNAGDSASTTLGANVGTTTLAATVTATATTLTVASAASFPASGTYTIQVDSEQMTVTGGQGTTTWTVTRGVNGTSAAAHSSAAAVNQTTMTVASASSFPASSDYTVLVGSEKMQVTAGQGTTTWTVTRAVDGTTAAAHASGAAVATSPCRSLDGTSNVNTACDSILTYSPGGESYPGTPTVSRVTIANTGSIAVSDLEVWMPSCLRGITPDAPFASSVPGAPSFSGASTTGGHLSGLTTYYYEVTAVTASGESIAGAEASYTPPFGTNTNQITLTWSAVSGATAYKVYRSDSGGLGEGNEQLLASGIATTSYTDSSATSPSGSPPSGAGSGDPCVNGTAQLYIQETNASGTATECWYPTSGTTCGFDGTFDLGLFAQYLNSLGTSLDLGAGPTAVASRYFTIGVQLPSGSANALQGTTARFTLLWYAQT